MNNGIESIFKLTIFAISMLFCGLLSVYFGQDSNWDLMNYHFYNPFAFLNARVGFDYQPAQVQTYLNPLIDVPFYLLVIYLPPIWVGFIMGALQGLNLFMLYCIGNYVFNFKSKIIVKIITLSCAIVGIYGPVFISELGTTFNDTIVSLFGLFSLLIILKNLKKNQYDQKYIMMKWTLLISGFTLGVGIGLKMSLAFLGVGCLISIPLLFRKLKERLVYIITWGTGVFAGILTSSGFWMVTLWDRFHNPLFPFLNTLFKSPYWELGSGMDKRFLPKNITQQLFYPFYFAQKNHLVMESNFRDLRFAIIYVLVLLGIIKLTYKIFHRKLTSDIRDKKGYNYQGCVTRFLVTYLVASYVLWQFTFSIYRYLSVLELLGPIIIVLLCFYIINDFYKSTAVVAGLFLIIVLGMKAPNWGRLAWGDSFFGVRLPEMEYGKNSIIVITGMEGVSYVIPFFPEDSRVIRVESNFQNPGQKNLMQQEIRQLLGKPAGQVYLLTSSIEFYKSTKVIKSYNLYANKENCKPISSRLTKDLVLCPLEYKMDQKEREYLFKKIKR